MESFSDQLKRHDKYFTQLAHHAKSYIDQNIKVQQATQKFAQTIYTFAQGELQHNRQHLQAFGELLQKQADSIAIQLRNMQEFFDCFNIKPEIQQMKVIATAQAKAVQPFNKEMNLQFIQNAAVYQQNRQRQLKMSMINLSNAYMAQAAALFEAATHMRQISTSVDDLAPRVDMARRFVHLELETDIYTALQLSKQDFDNYDIRGYLPPPAEVTRRGTPRMDEYNNYPSTQPSIIHSYAPNNNIAVQNSVSLQPGLGMMSSQPPVKENISDIQQSINQPIQQVQQPQQLQSQQPIKNTFYQQQPHVPQQIVEPQIKLQPSKQPIDGSLSVSKRYPHIKQYEFGDSLFDEESDQQQPITRQFQPANTSIDPENTAPQVDIAFDDQFQEQQSKYLLDQLSTMKQMIEQLTNPNSDQQSAGEKPGENLGKQMSDAVKQGGLVDPDAYI